MASRRLGTSSSSSGSCAVSGSVDQNLRGISAAMAFSFTRAGLKIEA